MRLELFQGVFNYKIAGRDNYVNKIDKFQKCRHCTLKAGGQHVLDYKERRKDAKPICQIRPTLDLLN